MTHPTHYLVPIKRNGVATDKVVLHRFGSPIPVMIGTEAECIEYLKNIKQV